MEEIDGTKSSGYSPLLLYIDDIEALYAALISECEDVSIVINQSKFSDINDLVAHIEGRRFQDFSISATRPYLTLTLNAWSSRLYVGSTKSTPLGIFHRLDEILKACRRQPVFVYSVWTPNILSVTGAVLSFLNPRLYLAVTLPITGVALAWYAFILYWTSARRNVVVIARKHSVRGITESFGAGFWANLISAIVGGLLVVILSHLLKIDR